MESKEKVSNSKGAGFAEWALFFWGGMGLFSSMMWMLTKPESNWLWFSRFAVGVICIGLAGIIREIRKLRESKENIEEDA